MTDAITAASARSAALCRESAPGGSGSAAGRSMAPGRALLTALAAIVERHPELDCTGDDAAELLDEVASVLRRCRAQIRRAAACGQPQAGQPHAREEPEAARPPTDPKPTAPSSRPDELAPASAAGAEAEAGTVTGGPAAPDPDPRPSPAASKPSAPELLRRRAQEAWWSAAPLTLLAIVVALAAWLGVHDVPHAAATALAVLAVTGVAAGATRCLRSIARPPGRT